MKFDIDQRQKNICIDITPRYFDNKYINYFLKCIFDETSKKCLSKNKECSEIKDKDIFNSHEPNEFKRCIFINNICQEQYKTCEIYNNEINDKNKKEEDFQSIEPIYNDNIKYKCNFIKEMSTCQRKRMECEDYRGTR